MYTSLVKRPAARITVSVTVALALFVFATLAATGCGGAATAKPTAAPTYSEADNGRIVTLAVGQSFTVTLKENPTTGYQWKMVVGPGLRQVSDKYTPDAQPSSGPPLAGAGGTYSWVLKAATAGTRTLTGIYARPWVPKNSADFSLTIVVK
jgi:inhibitor of cysteine peptidase